MKRTLLILLFFTLSFSLSAQRFTSFSMDGNVTIEEMKTFLETAPKDRQKEAEQLLTQFTEFWQSPWMDSKAQENFIEVANVMLQKKMRPFPHFQAYIGAYIAFMKSEFTGDIDIWSKIIQYHIQNDVSEFQSNMKLYSDFFSDFLLNNQTNSRWTVYGLAEKIGMDKEPYIMVSDVDLVGASKQDSLTIFSSSGKFFPASKTFKGKGGFISWDRAGLGAAVKAQLKEYTVDVRFPKVSAEDALLYYPDLFSTPVKGVVEDKAGLASSEEKATYPRFRSYDNYIAIKNIYENVDYIGGFEMRGASIMGASDGVNLAKIFIYKNKKVIVSAESKNFLLKTDNVLSEDASISIYIEEDSIYHPAANFKYNEITKELLISRPKLGVGRSPFFDSYHKMDITAEAIAWIIDTETIEFKPIIGKSSESSAIFESQNYFDKSVMKKIQGANDLNPLFTLWELFKTHDYQPLHLQQVVNWFKKSEIDIKAMMIDLAGRGFIEYDIINDQIIYRSKISQYLNNDVRRKDFDNIILESKSHYASLDLVTNDLRITGCDFFVLSDAQIVNVYPVDEKVTVKKNRNMVFSGRVVGGLFDFVAHNCQFDYGRFQVEMNVIDSMIMYVPDENGPQNMYGEYQLRRVNSTIEELAGTLYIDKPGNKSGMTDFPDYPIFEARKGGKVFYDHPYTLNRAYTRDRFYYVVDMFRIKNLDNFEIDSMKFSGELVSGGIFPNIREPLKTRPDFSLGFVYHTPQAGMPAYGKGRYFGIVDLSNRGFRGEKSKIEYITSSTVSDSLVFYLDSCNGSVKSHTVEEQMAGIEFPPASIENAHLHWEPYQDQMFVQTLATPMTVFNEIQLFGYSKLTPSGMYGSGLTKFKMADLTSPLFRFKHHEMLADTSDLRIYNMNSEDIAFSTDNYHAHVNFQTRKGIFESNGSSSEVFFVKNEMRTNASSFDWDPIDETILRFKWEDPFKKVDINNTPSRELVDMKSEGNELIATDPGKKGLQFNALNAEFDFSKNIIKANGVRYVNSGDAAIIPYNGEVTVYEKARLEIFNQARILAGRENKYHELYNCIAEVMTGNDFRGSGFYDYIDENKTVQTLHFDTVWFYKTTQGNAKIPLEKEFKFSSHFAFDGRAELHSDQKFLSYFGGVELIHDCDTVKRARMKILQQVDPNNIYLEIHDRTKDINDRKVVVAIASTNKEGRIYTCFGAAKDQFNDAEYISVFGFITYDKESQEFRAASMDKLLDPSSPGNMITLNKSSCIATGTGSIDMGAKLGRVNFNTNGTIVNYMRADSAVMHLTTAIDFFFNDESMKIMNKSLENSSSLNFVDVSSDPDYDMALQDILGTVDYKKYQRDMALGNQSKKLPEKLQVKFLFSRLDFEWDKDNSSFISQKSLPLIICGAKQVYKTVPGRIVIEKRGSRNRLYLYFEVDKEYFFFQFENNSMYGYSSVKTFNEAIMSVKAKNKTIKSEKGKPSFTYKIGNRGQQKKFVNKYFPVEMEEEDSE